MTLALVNGRILTDAGLVEDKVVLIEGDRIRDVVARDARWSADREHDLGGRLLTPGFIDTQVNGGGGVLFNDDPSVESIIEIGRAHRRFGTVGFLPTLISDDLHVVSDAIHAVQAAIERGVPGVLGIHIEGPYLNAERKGVHDASKLRWLDEDALGLLTSLKGGKTLVTLAPERTTPHLIQKLTKAGVIVSAGHTNATYEQVKEALAHGLSGFTHLFNAMSQLTSREPGVVGAALDDAEQLVRHHSRRTSRRSGRTADRHAQQTPARGAQAHGIPYRSLHARDRRHAQRRGAEQGVYAAGTPDLSRRQHVHRRGRPARGLRYRHGDGRAQCAGDAGDRSRSKLRAWRASTPPNSSGWDTNLAASRRAIARALL